MSVYDMKYSIRCETMPDNHNPISFPCNVKIVARGNENKFTGDQAHKQITINAKLSKTMVFNFIFLRPLASATNATDIFFFSQKKNNNQKLKHKRKSLLV